MYALYGPFNSALYACGEMILIEKIKNRGMLRATPAVRGASSILSLGFDDLATIANGRETDMLSMKPFAKSFTKKRIVSAWEKTGFVLFTRKCLENKKVCHELGQTDANEELHWSRVVKY
jgi:hypothetical protein